MQKEKKKGAIEREERARRTREREKVKEEGERERRERQTKRKKGNAARGEGERFGDRWYGKDRPQKWKETKRVSATGHPLCMSVCVAPAAPDTLFLRPRSI